MKRQALLTIPAILVLAVFFILPDNHRWLTRITGYASQIPTQLKQPDEETRLLRRFGNEYRFSKMIADSLKAKADVNLALLLIPSKDYFKQKGIDYPVPEPAVFYYFTGIKTTWPHSNMAIQSNWYVRVENKQLVVDTIPSKQVLEDSLKIYKQFPSPL